jgi:cyclohexyl-isocyanide hydratase
MTMTKRPGRFHIAIPIYEGVDLLDVAAPCEMFKWMGGYWTERKVSVSLVEPKGRAVRTRDGLLLTPDKSFDDYGPRRLQSQLIWVPGGDPPNLQKTMSDTRYLNFLREQSEGVAWVTSVCEGALLLASAGLLDGYKATTHWAFIPCLKSFPAIKVARGYPRFVVDRNRVTGGGISSGLDEALELIALIGGREIAEQVQSVTQYFPRPPVRGRIPGGDKCPIKTGPPPRRS